MVKANKIVLHLRVIVNGDGRIRRDVFGDFPAARTAGGSPKSESPAKFSRGFRFWGPSHGMEQAVYRFTRT